MCKKTIRPRNYPTQWIIRPYKNSLCELGFSLVELLFIITLISILLTLSFPVYRHLILELRLFILTERVSSTLNYAQSEAIKRQTVITICKSKNGKSCLGNWKEGWIVLVNKNATPSFENTQILHVYSALSHSESIEWRGFRSNDYLQLYPDGSSQNGSFILCVHELSKKMVWLIKISQTGRIRIDKENAKNLDCNA
jgi:type IV fimbrial biogenesis protein FimT